MNKVELVGRIANDVEMYSTEKGTRIARFSLAVKKRGKDKGAGFFSCVAFDKLAELVEQYCRKGDLTGVVGRLVKSSYETKHGDKAWNTDVTVEEIHFLAKKGEKGEDGKDEGLPF